MRNKKSVLMTLNHNYGYFSGVGSGIAGNGKVYEKWGIRKHRISGRSRKSDGSWGLHYTATPPFLIYNVVSSSGLLTINFK
jgi:hypothetical protein